MFESKDGKVTVKVEVVVEGGQATPAYQTLYKTNYPLPSPNNTPVRKAGNVNYIPASGNLTLGGSAAWVVRAQAYPDPALDYTQAQYATPPQGAPSAIPAVDGSWAFNPANNNEVPGATCDGVSGGPNNSTLLVWYAFPGQTTYKLEATRFHGYCPPGSGFGSPSGSGGGMSGIVHPIARHPLYATFTGALASLGTVTLQWNGSCWVGMSASGGGAWLSFSTFNSNCTFISAGPGTTFAVAGPVASTSPLCWSIEDTAVGTAGGPFGVTVTE